MESPPFEPLLVDTVTTARLLGLGRTKTLELIARGKIATVRVGTRVLVPRESIEAFIHSLKVSAGSS